MWTRTHLTVSGIVALTVVATSPAFGWDALWSTVLSDQRLATEVEVSAFSLEGDTGLQVAAASARDHTGKGIRLGIGYDNMVKPSRTSLEGSMVPLAISDRLFLLTTPCDKRFQFTLQISW
jgi:hypothetical protein